MMKGRENYDKRRSIEAVPEWNRRRERAVALHREFELPTFYVGLGEQPEDLQEFSPEFYADALFGSREEA